MHYEFHPEARVEYLEAIAHYEERQAGLGARFTIEVEKTIQRIVEAPTRWREIEGEIRRCLAHTFPYGVEEIGARKVRRTVCKVIEMAGK